MEKYTNPSLLKTEGHQQNQVKQTYFYHQLDFQANNHLYHSIAAQKLCTSHFLSLTGWASFSEKMLLLEFPTVPCLNMSEASATEKASFQSPLHK